MRIQKFYFTLLEILIVITLIAVIGGVFAINIRKAISEQKYRTEVELVVDTLRLAQDLMLIVGADIHVYFKAAPNDKGIACWIESDGGLPKNWELTIKRSSRIFSSIRTISFKDQRPFLVKEGQLDIRFQSQGSMMSRGVLRLSPYPKENMEGPLRQAICLRGYPHPIISQPDANQTVTCEEEDDDSEARLTSQMQKEIIEDTVVEQKKDKPDKKTPNPPQQGK